MWAAVSRQRRFLNVFYTLAKFGYLNGKPKHLSGWHICPKIMHGIYNLYKLYIYISNLYRLYIEQRPQLLLLLPLLMLCKTRSGGLQKLFEIFKKYSKLEVEIEIEIEASQSGWVLRLTYALRIRSVGAKLFIEGARAPESIRTASANVNRVN